MERNRKLIFKIADVLETYPEKYNQESWGIPIRSAMNDIRSAMNDEFDKVIYDGEIIKCGTAHCIAGWAAALEADVRPMVYHESGNNRKVIDWGMVMENNGETFQSVSTWAQKKLGISSHDAGILFNECWRPAFGMSVSDALRSYADGAYIWQVTDEDFVY